MKQQKKKHPYWRPIETVPFDENILVSDGERIQMVSYHRHHGFLKSEGGYSSIRPKWWMPLPQLPEKQS